MSRGANRAETFRKSDKKRRRLITWKAEEGQTIFKLRWQTSTDRWPPSVSLCFYRVPGDARRMPEIVEDEGGFGEAAVGWAKPVADEGKRIGAATHPEVGGGLIGR